MSFVFISVIFSVTVAVILKLARRYSVDAVQIIVWNYPVAVLSSYFLLEPSLYIEKTNIPLAPWSVYLALGVFLPGVFFAIAGAIRYTGIVRTEVAQRISLIIPLVASFFLFKETPEPTKLIGVGVGFAAILCCIGWHTGHNQYGGTKKVWLYPLIVFFGLGGIDVLFKKIATNAVVSYATSLFVVFTLAMITSFAYLLYMLWRRRKRFSVHAIFWGVVLGLFNFGNILFYMKAHRALPENPSIVFTGMNIGVILLGAVVGVAFFNEKLSYLNKIGIALSILSVIIIFLA